VLGFCDIELKSSLPVSKAYPKALVTIGDHIRARRITLGMLQNDLAKVFGVCEDSITGWENNRSIPLIQFMPGIIKFLGYIPIPTDQSSYAGKIFMLRMLYGVSQDGLSDLLHVNEASICNWENGKYPPTKRMKGKIDSLMLKGMNGIAPKAY
jgi:DNA-binding XRE family transcriptional regulator